MRVLNVLMVGVALLLSCSHGRYADAASQDTVLGEIRAADQSMQQGTFTFTKEDSSPRLSGFNGITEGVMAYDSNGRYRLHYRSGHRGTMPKAVSTEMFDGQYDPLLGGMDTNLPGVVLSSTSQMRPIQRILGVFAGPSLIMGRGLSMLNPTTVTQGADGLTLQARAPDGTQLTAVLDPAHQYVAKQIERRDPQGRVIGRWSFGPPIKSRHGPFIASSCTYLGMMSSGAVAVTTKTTIAQADFAPPNPDAFVYHLGKAGVAITDGRLAQPATFIPRVDRDISPDQLLRFSKHELAVRAQQQAEDENYTRGRLAKRTTLVVLPLLIFATAVTFRRIRLARTK